MAAAAPDIGSPDDLEKWLDGREPNWARAIAARAALRVFPLVFTVLDVPDKEYLPLRKQRMVLRVFRAMFIAWAARQHSDRDVASAATAAAHFAEEAFKSADGVGAFAASRAARAVAYASAVDAAAARAADYASTAAATAATAYAYATADASASAAADDPAATAARAAAADAAATALWDAITEDCRWLEGNDGALIGQPLWLNPVAEDPKLPNMPDWARQPLDRIRLWRTRRDILRPDRRLVPRHPAGMNRMPRPAACGASGSTSSSPCSRTVSGPSPTTGRRWR